MRNRIFLLLFTIAAFAGARAQDESPSLGDVARQSRQQKQRDSKAADSKDASAKSNASKDAQTADAQPAKSKHVITDDEIPSRSGPTGYRPPNQFAAQYQYRGQYAQPNYGQPSYGQPDPNAQKMPPQYWAQQMQAAKDNVANMQAAIDRANSTQNGSCIADCVQWNLEQQHKQQQVEMMKSQVEALQKNLEQSQEMCRQQGYGGSVCDP